MPRLFEPDREVLSAHRWPTNAHLIDDAAYLGYLPGTVLDVTYGEGVFWRQWQPEQMIASDLDSLKARDLVADFRHLPFGDGSFDTVVYDPPYKLNGTPSAPDARYGVHLPTRWQDRMELLRQGLTEVLRVARRYALVKVADQVCSGHKVWQTFEVHGWAVAQGATLVDRFDLLRDPRSQPGERRQVHTHGNYSTLLVYEGRP